MLGRFQDVRQEAGRRGEQSERADHGDRHADSHGDGARLPPGARYVPEAGKRSCETSAVNRHRDIAKLYIVREIS